MPSRSRGGVSMDSKCFTVSCLKVQGLISIWSQGLIWSQDLKWSLEPKMSLGPQRSLLPQESLMPEGFTWPQKVHVMLNMKWI